MVRFSKPPLASLGHCLVTASVKRRQSGCRVAMLISPEILQSLKGRRSLTMRKATSWYALLRVYHGFDGVTEPIMYHNDRSVNRGEPDVSCNQQVRCTTITRRKPEGQQAVRHLRSTEETG